MAKEKKITHSKEEFDKALIDQFNEGRLHADKKWIDEINERIKELEESVGIPELRRIRDKTRYRWKEEETKREKHKRIRR